MGNGLLESSIGENSVFHKFISRLFHLLLIETELLEAFLDLLVGEESILVFVAVVEERASELDHALPWDASILDHDITGLLHVFLGDTSLCHASDYFLVSQYTILVGIALLPVLVGGGVEVEGSCGVRVVFLNELGLWVESKGSGNSEEDLEHFS